MRRAEPGSVSHGTLRMEDLLPVFTDVLDGLAQSLEHSHLVARAKHTPPGHEDADETLNYLMEALDYYAPIGYMFGSHPGDGSDFGFWPIEEGWLDKEEARELFDLWLDTDEKLANFRTQLITDQAMAMCDDNVYGFVFSALNTGVQPWPSDRESLFKMAWENATEEEGQMRVEAESWDFSLEDDNEE
jgi:hypothetical protein